MPPTQVYNLCAEREYAFDEFANVERFPFDDHNPCAFAILEPLCDDVLRFLTRNASNVVAIHCKAGKGRTGLVISCVLLYLGLKARGSPPPRTNVRRGRPRARSRSLAD